MINKRHETRRSTGLDHSSFGGLAVAYLAVRDFNLFAAFLGPLFVVISVAGGVLKEASYSDGKWTIRDASVAVHWLDGLEGRQGLTKTKEASAPMSACLFWLLCPMSPTDMGIV